MSDPCENQPRPKALRAAHTPSTQTFKIKGLKINK